jgi:hypothetical protein
VQHGGDTTTMVVHGTSRGDNNIVAMLKPRSPTLAGSTLDGTSLGVAGAPGSLLRGPCRALPSNTARTKRAHVAKAQMMAEARLVARMSPPLPSHQCGTRVQSRTENKRTVWRKRTVHPGRALMKANSRLSV